MARVLIAGCGYVGGELGRRLVARGDLVWGLRRRPGDLADGIAPLSRDLTRPDTLADLPADIDAVVFTAGSDASSPEAYEAIYVAGLCNLLTALQAQGQHPARVLVVTSTAVYAQQNGEWVDESSPTEPTSFQGRTMLASEAAARKRPFHTTTVRFGGIYGPGRTRIVDQIRRRALRIAPGTSYTNRIHRDDCAGVLAHLLDVAHVDNVYLGVDCEPATRREVVDWIADRLGVERPGEDPQAAGPLNKRCSNRRLLASGFEFQYPTFREGYGALIDGG